MLVSLNEENMIRIAAVVVSAGVRVCGWVGETGGGGGEGGVGGKGGCCKVW